MRLWPVSRRAFPKQFLRFGAGKTLFQETILRVNGDGFGKPVIVAGNDHRFIVADQLREIDVEADILLEPERRDSCAAIVAAASLVARRDSNVPVLVLAADHVMRDATGFRDHVTRATIGTDAYLVTFGIRPTKPATGYGYIAPGEALHGSSGVHVVQRFVEKPDYETAQSYVGDGYLWNSGCFLFRARTFLDEAQRLVPEVVEPVTQSVDVAQEDLDFIRLDPDAFSRAKAISVDHAIMERSDRVAVLPSDYPWSDIGSWSSVWETNARDEDDNVALGEAVFHKASRNLVHSTDRCTALVGVEDLSVVSTQDALLVIHNNQAEELKALVENLGTTNPSLVTWHTEVHRPWGQYEQIDRGEGFLVKRITVKPGGILSLQSHRYRAEHWVVVSGVARVTIDDNVQDLEHDQSIYVPLGAVHRLENPGQEPLQLIEVQTGHRLEESDITRYEDVYNRG